MGYLVMKTCKFDLAMLLLMFTTLGIWFLTNHYSYIYGFLIYCAIFIYLIIKHRPISDFFIVILFSVMSLKGNSGVFEMEYVLITILFAYTVYNIFKQKKIVVGKMLLPLICFLLYSGLSIIWTPVLKDGYLGFIGMLEGYLVYFILTNGFFKIEKKQLNKISKLATYVMLTLSVQIFSVYFTRGFERVLNYKRLVNLGWGYSNFIAVIFVLLIPLALYKYIDKKHYYFIYFIFDIFNIFALVLTQSRGAYVGVIVSLVIFSCFYLRKTMLLKYGSIMIIPTSLFIIFFNDKFLRLFNVFKDRFITKDVVDDSGRFELFKLALNTFFDKFLFGNGLNSGKYMISNNLDNWVAHYHNFILQIASALGIIGLILFGFIVLRWIKILFKPKDAFLTCSAISIIGGLTHQLLDVSFDLFYFGVYFYGIIAIAEIYRHYNVDEKLKFIAINKLIKNSDNINNNK